MNQRKSEGNTSAESRTDSHQTQTNHDVVFQIENSQRNATMRRCETFRSCILIRTEFVVVALATNLFDKCLQLHPPSSFHFPIFKSVTFIILQNFSCSSIIQKTKIWFFVWCQWKRRHLWTTICDRLNKKESMTEEQIKRNLKMKLDRQCILVLNNWWLLLAPYTSEYQMNITRVHVVLVNSELRRKATTAFNTILLAMGCGTMSHIDWQNEKYVLCECNGWMDV